MRLRKVPPTKIVDARIRVIKSGLNLTTDQLEHHHLAGGQIDEVVEALVAAKNANVPMTFAEACQVDLASRFS